MLHARASYFAQWPRDRALQGQVEHLPFPFVLTAAFNQKHYIVDRLSPGYGTTDSHDATTPGM